MSVDYSQDVYLGVVFTDEEMYTALGWSTDTDAYLDGVLARTGLVYETFGDLYSDTDIGWVVGVRCGRTRPRGKWTERGEFGPFSLQSPLALEPNDVRVLMTLSREILGEVAPLEMVLVKSVY